MTKIPTEAEVAHLPYRPCVGVMLVNARNQVFVGQRIDSEIPAWQMPQGGVDPGEDPQEAALRELWEETGVTRDKVQVEAQTEGWLPYELPLHLVPKLWKGRYRGQEQKWFLMRFSGQDSDIDISAVDEEFSEWRWLPHDQLVDQIVPFKRTVYEQVLAAFADHLQGA